MPTWPGTPHTFVALETPDATLLNTNIRDTANFFKNLFDNSANLSFVVATTLTLSSNTTGAVTPTQNLHKVDTLSAAAAGDLATLTIAGNIVAGCVVRLTAANVAHVVTVKNGAGNLVLAKGDFALNTADRWIEFLLVGTTWYEQGRSDLHGALITTPELRGYKETRVQPSIVSNALTIDLALGNLFEFQVTANITTTTIQNIPAAGKVASFVVKVQGDGTARTWTWFATTAQWGSGAVPTRTSANLKIDFYMFITGDGGTTWYGFVMDQNF